MNTFSVVFIDHLLSTKCELTLSFSVPSKEFNIMSLPLEPFPNKGYRKKIYTDTDTEHQWLPTKEHPDPSQS